MLWFIRAQPAIYPEQYRAVPAAVAVCRLHANADESQLNWKKKTKNWNWISFLKWAKQNEMKWNKWVTPHCACSNCKGTQRADALLCLRSLVCALSPSLICNWPARQAWWQSVTLLSHSHRICKQRERTVAHVSMFHCQFALCQALSSTLPSAIGLRHRLAVTLRSHCLRSHCLRSLVLYEWRGALPSCCLHSLIEFACRESAFHCQAALSLLISESDVAVNVNAYWTIACCAYAKRRRHYAQLCIILIYRALEKRFVPLLLLCLRVVVLACCCLFLFRIKNVF